MKTRILFLCLQLLAGTSTGFALDGTAGSLTWTLENGTLAISGNGAIPDYSFSDYAPWYPYNLDITTVVIGDGVTGIGDRAFQDCYSLASVTVSGSVTRIGDEAFIQCGKLTSVTIPEGVTSIGNNAFYYCITLAAIDVDENNAAYASENGVLFNKTKMTLIQYPEGKQNANYSIPEGVTSIGDYAFSRCGNLVSVTISGSVTSIENDAFSWCRKLNVITVPESVTSIGEDAFYGTLWEDNQPDGVIYINNVLYKYKGDMPDGAVVDVREGTVSISPYAFLYCGSLTSITIPGSVTSIGNYAFAECGGLTEITIPIGTTSIGDGTFAECGSLISVTIHGGVTSIGASAFSACSSLAHIAIPESVTSIGGAAFISCRSLTSITVPEGVTSIEGWVFLDCIGLTSVTIPASVTSIGDRAFFGCSSLTSVTNRNPKPQEINSNVFGYVVLSAVALYVPAGSIEAYRGADVWKGFEMIAGITAIETLRTESGVSIYPNPVAESFRIKGVAAPTQATVTDLSGRAVLTQMVEGDEPVAVGHLPRGVYIVRVGGKTVKVIKK
ncbi:MAG: leucine-rich repeat domain-containing protein [Tannerella sp.]|jgi:hypothetical protein|nr:leucine-rich repeat domain-containing protein [Tannerella sp.]